MAIKKVKIGSTEHELETRIPLVAGLQAELNKRPEIKFVTDDEYKDISGTDSDGIIYFIRESE